MRMLLVQPWHTSDKSYRSKYSFLISYAPLTLATLKALIPKNLDVEIDVCDEMVEKINKYLKKQYDIVVITLQTSAAIRSYEIAKIFKEKGSYIVMGGYHPTYMPEEAGKHADTVIIGAGEYSFPKFLNDFVKGKPKKVYNMQNIKGKDIVSPDRSVIPKRKYLKYPAVIANRGCPNHCEFCVISEMWKSCGPRPIKDVIEEIKSLKSKLIIFFDPNFFAIRDYAIELMHELKKLKIKWSGSATINVAFDEELMQLAEESGCKGLLVGLESLSINSLRKAKKGFNDPNKYKEAIEIMHKHKISVNGCFILGLDGDTEELLLSIPEQINYLKLNLARFSILTPVPNSPLYKRLEREGRIIINDWSQYTQHIAVYKPKNMTKERLEEIYKQVWKETYTWKNIFRRVRLLKNNSISEKLICLGANIGFKFLGMN
ncbi:MAG: radical SAM protein [Bacilli bacterium]|nr:radical SAM protein [Bacilli bacterium]